MEVHPISEVTKEWTAVASPTILLTSLYFYYATVSAGCYYLKTVPKDPNAKDPFWLKCVVIFHNVFLVSLSLYMCLGCIYEAVKNNYTLWGRGTYLITPR